MSGDVSDKKFSKGIGMDTFNPTIDVYSEQYMATPGKYGAIDSLGFDVDPVDAYGAFVPLDRDDNDNLSNAQENVQRRFNLNQTQWGSDPFIDQKAHGGSFSPNGNAFNNKIRK